MQRCERNTINNITHLIFFNNLLVVITNFVLSNINMSDINLSNTNLDECIRYIFFLMSNSKNKKY